MRRIRIVGLCLVAVFAMSAIASATASAEAPEMGQCLKKKVKSLPGYTTSKCTVEATEVAKGSFEWVPGAIAGKNTFSTTGGVATLLTTKGESVTCESEESTGEYLTTANNKEESTTVTFKKCSSGGLTCTTEGKAAGELVTKPLIGIVGFENHRNQPTKPVKRRSSCTLPRPAVTSSTSNALKR